MTVQTTTGSRIREARTQLGLSIAQLAGRIVVQRKTLESWEKDRLEPRGEDLMRLAGVLQVSMIWLLTGDRPRRSDHDEATPGSDALARKLKRALAMQHDLAVLLSEVSAEVTELRKDLEEDRDLVA